MNNFLQGDNFTITKLLLIETANDYKNIPQRSYNLNASHSTMYRLDDILTSSVGGVQKQLTTNEVASCIPDIIGLTPKPVGLAQIPNGWNTTRLRFLMETVYDYGNGSLNITYLQGFTDYYDPSRSGLLDPSMRFHINSIVNVTRTMSFNPDGTKGYPFSRVSSMYNVISDVFGNMKFEEVQTPDTIKLCRPTDIASNLFALELTKPREGEEIGYNIMRNMTDTITNYKPATSSRKNNNPYSYITNTLNAFTATKAATEIGHNDADIISSASNAMREPDLSQCLFIDRLIQYRGYVAESPSSFTISELDGISPGTSSTRTTVVARDAQSLETPHNMLTTQDTAEIFQPTAEATKSSTVAASITGIMLDNLITRLGFSSTNMTGQPEVILTDINSFMDGIDPVYFAERVKTAILTTLIPNISDGNLSTYDLYVTADLLGDITVGIQLNSTPTTVFRFPAFADSLYSPVVSKVGHNQILINDFQSVIDHTVLSKF